MRFATLAALGVLPCLACSAVQVEVEPVVIRDVPPATLEQAVKSFSGFFGSLALGPLIGGGVG